MLGICGSVTEMPSAPRFSLLNTAGFCDGEVQMSKDVLALPGVGLGGSERCKSSASLDRYLSNVPRSSHPAELTISRTEHHSIITTNEEALFLVGLGWPQRAGCCC